jgi:DNA-binding XRE family transcriptional regulator
MNPNLRYIGNEANFLKNIGFRIQFFRKKSGLSQEELAEKSGLSYSTISHIESSTPYPMSMVRFLYKGIIIKHNKTEPTYTKTSLFLCEKRRFFMARTEKGVVTTI